MSLTDLMNAVMACGARWAKRYRDHGGFRVLFSLPTARDRAGVPVDFRVVLAVNKTPKGVFPRIYHLARVDDPDLQPSAKLDAGLFGNAGLLTVVRDRLEQVGQAEIVAKLDEAIALVVANEPDAPAELELQKKPVPKDEENKE